MPPNYSNLVLGATLLFGALGILAVLVKRRRSFVRVGRISKLTFFPVKSLKGIEVEEGECTPTGFVVNGVLDRAFMLVNLEGKLVSQREQPSLTFLQPRISGKTLTISGPDCTPLSIEIRDSVGPQDKLVKCRIHGSEAEGADCGEEVARWFQNYLKTSDVRLIRFFPTLTKRKCVINNPFQKRVHETYHVSFQDLSAIHLVSEASVEDISSRVEDVRITASNFRPNILVSDCLPFDEDSWDYMKLDSGVMLQNLCPTGRCILTTNDPETGVLTKKEPLVSLRQYRIPKEAGMRTKVGVVPCLGTCCAVLKNGTVRVGDDIFAVISKKLLMTEK